MTQKTHDSLIGQVVDGKYKIERKIGAGNMGVVYRVNHTTLNKTFALKALSPTHSQIDEAVKRFFREAHAASLLHHPNIIETFDLGFLEDMRPFLIMEYCEGEDLKTHFIKMDHPNFDLCIHVVHQIAKALDALHEENLIHRDVKPHNILLLPQKNGSLRFKLADFGLASLTTPTADIPKITQMGHFTGTPAYTSPEAYQTVELDGRADVYSLSTVAYQLITGRLPFRGRSNESVLIRKVEDDPPTVSQGFGKIHVPGSLEQVMKKGLARNRENRYDTAGEFSRDLGEALIEFAETLSSDFRARVMPSMATFEGESPQIQMSSSLPPHLAHQRMRNSHLPKSQTKQPSTTSHENTPHKNTSHQSIFKSIPRQAWIRLMVAILIGFVLGLSVLYFGEQVLHAPQTEKAKTDLERSK